MRDLKEKEGKTTDIAISVSNYSNKKEYEGILEVCHEKFEIEFISDGISKKFYIMMQIENSF